MRILFLAYQTIKISNGCEVQIENSVRRVTVRHHRACSHYGFFFLHPLPSTIAFKFKYRIFLQFYAKITIFLNLEMFGSVPTYGVDETFGGK